MKRRLMMIFSLILVLFLVSCGKSEKGTAEEKKTGNGNKLIVYSNSIADGRAEWLKNKAKEKGFDLEFVEGGGSEISNRLIAEKNNPVADVVYGPNQIDSAIMKKENVFEKYTPKWASEVPQEFNDKEGFFHAIGRQSIFIVYDTSQVSEADAPKDWLELPTKYKGKYEVSSSLGSGTPRVVISGIIMRYKDPNGELGISAEGWKVISEYFKNGVPSVKGEDLFARMTNKKVAMGQMWSTGLKIREKQYSTIKTGIVKPEIGMPNVTEQIGIVKGSKNLEKAKEFVDWFGSAEVQAEWSKAFATIPANTKALDMTDPQIKEYANSFGKAQDIDWQFVADNISKWIEKIELEILQ